MGYNITIGGVVIDADYSKYSLHVPATTSPNAPNFVNDDLTGQSNRRYPSYTAWRNFASKVGLTELFYDSERGLFNQHPGIAKISAKHLAIIKEAHEAYKKVATLPIGCDSDEDWATGTNKYDYELVRLAWLEYWVDYALTNFKYPSISNS